MQNKDLIKKLIEQKTFEIHVKINQKKREIYKDENKIFITTKQKPENNKANDEIEQYLTKLTGKCTKIIKGKTKRKKIIRLIN